MECVLRLALPPDADAIAFLAAETYVSAFGSSMSRADLDAHIKRELCVAAFSLSLGRDAILLAEIRGIMVGFAQFGAAGPDLRRWGSGELRRLYVRSSHQNHGIGTRLLEAALLHPVLRDEASVVLDVWEENERAIQLYARYGFESVGAKEFEVDSGAETSLDLVMVRRAQSPDTPSA